MERKAPSDFNDYGDILRRRWHLLAFPTFAATVLMLVITAYLPKTFKSETLILVDPQKLPNDIVRASTTSDVAERLQNISQQVLSRTQLQKIIEQFDLYKSKKGMAQEDIVELMRRDIGLEIVNDQRVKSMDVTAFKITYMGGTPNQAQQVARQLGSLFIEQNMKVREQTAEGTNQFLDTELEKARQALNQQEEKIKQFKSQHMGALPEQQQANQQVIGQLQAMLQANTDALNRDNQSRNYIQSLAEAVKKGPLPDAGTAQLEGLRNELLAAEQKYKPKHPDVVRLRAEVKAMENQAKSRNEHRPEGDTPLISSQLAAIEQDIKERTRRGNELEAKIRSMEGRMENLPTIEQEFAELNRDHDIMRTNYQSLLQKKNASSMAVEMERGAKGEQFRILDPASLPEKPSKPNMLQLNLIGLLVGLSVGCGLAYVQEMKDSSLHTERDIEHYVPFRVLGSMPEIATRESLVKDRNKRIRRWVMRTATVGAGLSVVVVLVMRGKINFSAWF